MVYRSLLGIQLLSLIGLLAFYFGFFLTRHEIHEKNTCSYEVCKYKKFSKLVFILFDALRYDFIEVVKSNSQNYHNHFNVVHDILQKQHQNSLLLKFIADPPTTTMQRLKALTTGSLPTFIDFSNNYYSKEILEDNLIFQMKSHFNQPLVFMGDDTWKGLFPKSFDRAYFYPSLNVMDLHSVDNGCEENLFKELKNLNYSLLIAHFLGLDHAGHRYDIQHLALRNKLQQYNRIIANIVQLLPHDALLVVMGDHGMTAAGDHGGDTSEEVTSALFMYSKTKFIDHSKNDLLSGNSVSQVDLVPTLSVLLGIPIPFSNLGVIIPQVFRNNVSEFSNILQINLNQITNWIARYKLEHALPLQSEHLLNISSYQNMYMMLKNVKFQLSMIWAEFNFRYLYIGLFTLFCSLVLYFGLICHLMFKSSLRMNFDVLISFSLIILHSLCSFSNSFIINESGIVRFLLITLFFTAIPFSHFQFIAMWVVTFTRYFFSCRFVDCCTPYFFAHHLSSLPNSTKQLRLMLSLTCLFFFTGVKTVFVLPSLAIAFYWALHGLSLEQIDAMPDFFLLLSPRVVYFSYLTIFCVSLLAPSFSSKILTSFILEHMLHSMPFIGRIFCILNIGNTILIFLLTSDGFAPAVFLIFVECSLIAYIAKSSPPSKFFPLIASIYFVGVQGFYQFGHHLTISSIKFDVAYIGFSGEWENHLIPGFLIIFQTFSSYIIAIFFLPILFQKDVLSLSFVCYNFATFLKLLCNVLANYMLRRHLMVWEIFAPSLLFQSIVYIIAMIYTTFILILYNFFIFCNKI